MSNSHYLLYDMAEEGGYQRDDEVRERKRHEHIGPPGKIENVGGEHWINASALEQSAHFRRRIRAPL
jgi:hypothetical protein